MRRNHRDKFPAFSGGLDGAAPWRMAGLWRPPSNSYLRVRHERWRVERSIPHDSCVVVEVVGAGASNRGHLASFVLPYEACDRLPTETRPRRVTRRGWRRLVRCVLSNATPSPHALRTGRHSHFDPIPFQLEPALAYLRGDATRFLIADAVGLGKTVQAGLLVAEMLERRREGRALVVVPGGLREQWRDELRHHFQVHSEVLDAEGLWRLSAQLPEGVNPWMVPAVAITSIDFVKRPEVLRSLEPLVWDVVVFDEAHTLCGHSDRRVAATALATRGRAVVLVTATPHSGDEDAFVRLCALGDIEGRCPLAVFRRTRAELGESRPRRSIWLRPRADGAEAALHASLLDYARRAWLENTTPGARLAMLVLLKRGASSTTALARTLSRRRDLLAREPGETAESQIALPLGRDDEEPGSELGAPGFTNRRHELQVLDHLLELARCAVGVPRKISVLARLFRRTRDPVVVFTQYRDTLDELALAFPELSVVRIHGGLTARERLDAARAFTRGSVRVLLATDAASEGLNLHARCRLVVSFDLPWTPLRIEQRVGRVDRIGQMRRVHAWQMVAHGTYEDVVAERVRSRAAVAHAAIRTLESEDEHDTAASLLAGAEGPLKAPASSCHRPLHLHPATAMAEAEASRLITARRMARCAAPVVDRPFVPARPARRRRLLLVYQATFADPSGIHCWDALFGLVRGQPPHPLDGAGPLRDWGEAGSQVVRAIASRHTEDLRPWRRMAAAALWRDRAIAQLLRNSRAHLSSSLVQPGLFSNRGGSTRGPQLQLLDASIARLSQASADARAIRRITLQRVVLLFTGDVPTDD